jgi:putative methyltransferase (TIGR01177 family)
LKNRSLVLLSGEFHSLPEAEARALFLAYDPTSRFEAREKRVLLVESDADPFVVSRRIAFARRVGVLVESTSRAATFVKGKTIRLRNFDLSEKPALDPVRYLRGFEADVDLNNPDYELTLVRGEGEYLALTAPGMMRQGWSNRRPRVRPYFHPVATFPKLARALVNLSRCKEGEIFLDPFCGTGSFPLEAAVIGAQVVALDRAEKMVRGSLANMRHFGQQWLGVVRCEALRPPITMVDAVATDVPYGRASSTMGVVGSEILRGALESIPRLLHRGSRAVVMHSLADGIDESSELAVEEEHDLHVHKKLTRRISVLRRR